MMKASMVAFAVLTAASHVFGAPESPTKVSGNGHATKVARQVKGSQSPSVLPQLGGKNSHGCYGSAGNMTLHPVEGMSSGKCNDECVAKNFWVSGLHATQCYCGYAYPPDSDLVGDDKCNFPCPFYDIEACGGLGKPGYWSVFNLGINVEAVAYEGSSTTASSTTPTSTHSSTSQSSSAPAVVTETEPAAESSQPDREQKSAGPNVAGIAGGVVAGVVGAAAIVGGLFFFLRRRRNAEIEEEHRRNAAVNAFINGSKPPGSSSGSISMTDARLDPVLANRRMSDGSIADNEDYSRRILRVTNA